MENDKPSRTSEAAAVHRAVHLLLDDEPKILLDPIALRLILGGGAGGGDLGAAFADAFEMPKGIDLNIEASKLVRSRLVMRSRYTEDCLADAVAQRAIRQYVILGAGLDTFAFRQPS